MSRVHMLLGWMVVLVLVFVMAPSVMAESDCDADVSVSLARSDPDQEVTRYQFQVEISTTEHCTEIHYDLILDVQLPNGQVKKVRKPRIVKLNDSSLEEVVRHELPLNQSIVGQETRLVECKVCHLGA